MWKPCIYRKERKREENKKRIGSWIIWIPLSCSHTWFLNVDSDWFTTAGKQDTKNSRGEQATRAAEALEKGSQSEILLLLQVCTIQHKQLNNKRTVILVWCTVQSTYTWFDLYWIQLHSMHTPHIHALIDVSLIQPSMFNTYMTNASQHRLPGKHHIIS